MNFYIISATKDGESDIDGVYYLIGENGECYASHWCSNKSCAYSDLYGNRLERVADLAEKYGDIKVLYLGEDEMTQQELLKRNKSYYSKDTKSNKSLERKEP